LRYFVLLLSWLVWRKPIVSKFISVIPWRGHFWGFIKLTHPHKGIHEFTNLVRYLETRMMVLREGRFVIILMAIRIFWWMVFSRLLACLRIFLIFYFLCFLSFYYFCNRFHIRFRFRHRRRNNKQIVNLVLVTNSLKSFV